MANHSETDTVPHPSSLTIESAARHIDMGRVFGLSKMGNMMNAKTAEPIAIKCLIFVLQI